jgi:hypothetical protein
MTEADRRNLLWGALGKMAAKEHSRPALAVGAYKINEICITAKVAGRAVAVGGQAELTVNADSVRASSAAPPYADLVAHLLGLLTPTVRRIVLDELPDQFAREGAIPEVNEEHKQEADSLLVRLRARTTQNAAGAVAVSYTLE